MSARKGGGALLSSSLLPPILSGKQEHVHSTFPPLPLRLWVCSSSSSNSSSSFDPYGWILKVSCPPPKKARCKKSVKKAFVFTILFIIRIYMLFFPEKKAAPLLLTCGEADRSQNTTSCRRSCCCRYKV